MLQIATVGSDTEPIIVGIREFPISRLVLLYPASEEPTVVRLVSQLSPLRLEVERHPVGEDLLLDVLSAVREIVAASADEFDEILLNVSSGSKLLSCAALSAAFVNGIRAFAVVDDAPLPLPVLKFSYAQLVSETKVRILEALQREGGSATSLSTLSQRAKIEKSLLSYHLRGGRDSQGLEGLGLVQLDRAGQGRVRIQLTPMGDLLLQSRTTASGLDGMPRAGGASRRPSELVR